MCQCLVLLYFLSMANSNVFKNRRFELIKLVGFIKGLVNGRLVLTFIFCLHGEFVFL